MVTGTLVSGAIQREEELEIFPDGEGAPACAACEVHGQAAEKAVAGERTALNLAGVATEDLARGMTLAPPHLFQSASRLDVKLSLLRSAKPLKDRARVHFHGYTSEIGCHRRSSYGQEYLHRARHVCPTPPGPSGAVAARRSLHHPAIVARDDHRRGSGRGLCAHAKNEKGNRAEFPPDIRGWRSGQDFGGQNRQARAARDFARATGRRDRLEPGDDRGSRFEGCWREARR